VVALVSLLAASHVTAQPTTGLAPIAEIAPRADTVRILRRSSGETLVLVNVDAEKRLSLFELTNSAAKKIAETESLGHVWGAALYGKGSEERIVVVYGLGRGDLHPPLRIVGYPLSLANSEEIKTFTTDRAQSNTLKSVRDKILITWFTSKYETETGWLTKANGTWDYQKALNVRMGTNSDSDGERIVIARPYGDKQGDDGDVLLYRDGKEPRTLPSYRGASSLAFLPNQPAQPSAPIFIGDGWHSNYGQVAQGRLSLLRPIPGTSRYALDYLLRIPKSYAVNKIVPISLKQVFLVADNQLLRADEDTEWRLTPLYTQTKTDSVFDSEITTDKKGETFAVIGDGAVTAYQVRTH